MRTLDRNRRTIYYALLEGVTAVVDDEGFDTGESEPVYGEAKPYELNVGTPSGTSPLEQFGINDPYTRTLVTDDMDCPFSETTILWIDCTPDMAHDYVVTGVGRGLDTVRITAKKVNA